MYLKQILILTKETQYTLLVLYEIYIFTRLTVIDKNKHFE